MLSAQTQRNHGRRKRTVPRTQKTTQLRATIIREQCMKPEEICPPTGKVEGEEELSS